MMLLIAMAITVAFVASVATVPRVVRPRLLVGARRPDHDHAARALAGDEGHRPGPGGPRRPGRAAARRGRTGHRGRRWRPSPSTARAGRRRGARPPRRPGAGRRRIVDGAAEVDESMVTGESRPVARGEGDRVVAGTVSTDSSDAGAGHGRRRRHRPGRDPAAGRRRPRLSGRGPRHWPTASRPLLFYVATAAGVITFVVWAALGRHRRRRRPDRHGAGHRLPPRPGPGHPAGHRLSTAISARPGILVKDRLALERMRTIDAVLFDKTGTLTRAATWSRASPPVSGQDEDRAAGVGRCRGVGVRASAGPGDRRRRFRAGLPARRRGLPGRHRPGGEAAVDGRRGARSAARPCCGSPARPSPRPLSPRSTTGGAEGRRCSTCWSTARCSARSPSRTRSAPRRAQAVTDLHRPGVRVVMITGDARQVAEAVAAELGIDEVFAEVLPEDKDSQVSRLQAGGPPRWPWSATGSTTPPPSPGPTWASPSVPAPTSPSSRPGWCWPPTTPAPSPASSGSPGRPTARWSRTWAGRAGYNVVAIPLAAGVLGRGPVVTLAPAVGAVLMSASTIVVALNAQLLRRVQLRA